MVLLLQEYIVHSEDNIAFYKEKNRRERERGKKERTNREKVRVEGRKTY